MTVLGDGMEDATSDWCQIGQADRARLVSNWVTDEVTKFDGRQEGVLQHLNEISVQRKLES
jgi:hypothetical protein